MKKLTRSQTFDAMQQILEELSKRAYAMPEESCDRCVCGATYLAAWQRNPGGCPSAPGGHDYHGNNCMALRIHEVLRFFAKKGAK